MKVLILSTFGNYGGASVCSRRLAEAMSKHNVDVKLACIHKHSNSIAQSVFDKPRLASLYAWILFCLERLIVLFSIVKQKYLYKFSSSAYGINILNSTLVKEADIIHLHWVNFGFLSIESIAKLAKQKPVIWTLHDMWAFTGGCHYALECSNYKALCSNCFYLRNDKIAESIQAKKVTYWKEININIAATSRWLAQCAKQSTIFNNREIDVLSTPIDTDLFRPKSNRDALLLTYGLERDKYYILIGAVDLTDERKGMLYLFDAITEAKHHTLDIHILTFGQLPKNALQQHAHTSFGSISDQEMLVDIYNLADVFILTSVQDNLPNTVMEALSCGVPVVAFDCGGVNDMVEHKVNGYLAENRNVNDLASGLHYFHDNKVRSKAGQNAREKVLNTYSEDALVRQHVETYEQIISNYHSK